MVPVGRLSLAPTLGTNFPESLKIGICEPAAEDYRVVEFRVRRLAFRHLRVPASAVDKSLMSTMLRRALVPRCRPGLLWTFG